MEASDAVVSFYAIFPLPRQEHQFLLRNIHCWLKSHGVLRVTLDSSDMECDEEADWLGAPMMWNSYPPEEFLRTMEQTDFAVRKSGFEGAPGDQKYHYWLLAEQT